MDKKSKWHAWLALALGAAYFLIPLVATFEFSLRMKRGEYSLESYRVVFSDQMFQETFLYSIVIALATILFSIFLIVPTAYWIHMRFKKLAPLVDFITLLPLVIPSIVIVFGYLRIFNSSSYLPMTDHDWSTNLLLVIAYTLLAMPYMYRSVDTGLHAIDVRTLTEASEILGAKRMTILRKVIVPNLTSSILSGAFLTFAIVIGEFTVASLLNRPAFGPYLQRVGANRAYEPSALAVIAFLLTWAAMGLIQLIGTKPVKN